MTSRRCIVMVGGSHSVHVKVPAGMLREAGYQVVLADLQPSAKIADNACFDAVHPLEGPLQRRVLGMRPEVKTQAVSPVDDGSEEPGEVRIQTATKWRSYLGRLAVGYLQAGILLDVIRRYRPGVVYFQSMTACGMTAYYLLSRMGWPKPTARPGLLTHLWGYQPRYPGVHRREIRALKPFDHIHTSSPAVGRIYRENYEVPNDQIDVFVRGINLATFAAADADTLQDARRRWNIPADKFVIIHNRHLHRMYRVDMAVQAVIELRRRGHDVFLMLVRGSMCQADYEQALVRQLQDAGMGDRVALMPPVLAAREMAVALQLAHCSVNCVPMDAFPVSILEAMYCRAVPVVRNLESYSEFVRDGETAFGVGACAEEYVQRIEQLIQQPELRLKLAQAGAELVQRQGSEEVYRHNVLSLAERCWHDW